MLFIKQYLKILTLLIFSLGCVRSAGKCDSASQFKTTCVCSSVPVTMLPTARSAAVWNKDLMRCCSTWNIPSYHRGMLGRLCTFNHACQPILFEQVVSDTGLGTEEWIRQTQIPALTKLTLL